MGYLPSAGNIVVDNCDIIGLTQNSNQVGGIAGYADSSVGVSAVKNSRIISQGSQVGGIAGYILTYNSHGLLLSRNKPFESIDKAIKEESDIISEIIVKETVERKTVGDTDIGKRLKIEIEDLKELLNAYRSGQLL